MENSELTVNNDFHNALGRTLSFIEGPLKEKILGDNNPVAAQIYNSALENIAGRRNARIDNGVVSAIEKAAGGPLLWNGTLPLRSVRKRGAAHITINADDMRFLREMHETADTLIRDHRDETPMASAAVNIRVHELTVRKGIHALAEKKRQLISELFTGVQELIKDARAEKERNTARDTHAEAVLDQMEASSDWREVLTLGHTISKQAEQGQYRWSTRYRELINTAIEQGRNAALLPTPGRLSHIPDVPYEYSRRILKTKKVELPDFVRQWLIQQNCRQKSAHQWVYDPPQWGWRKPTKSSAVFTRNPELLFQIQDAYDNGEFVGTQIPELLDRMTPEWDSHRVVPAELKDTLRRVWKASPVLMRQRETPVAQLQDYLTIYDSIEATTLELPELPSKKPYQPSTDYGAPGQLTEYHSICQRLGLHVQTRQLCEQTLLLVTDLGEDLARPEHVALAREQIGDGHHALYMQHRFWASA